MLFQIQTQIDLRVESLRDSYPDWPCQKGCDDCCRALAAEPLLSEAEWDLLRSALTPELETAIREGAGQQRPVICPLLDAHSGACRVYAVRPLACRSYGYYAEGGRVLGCHRIEHRAAHDSEILWGNHSALERSAEALGVQRPLSGWLGREAGRATA